MEDYEKFNRNSTAHYYVQHEALRLATQLRDDPECKAAIHALPNLVLQLDVFTDQLESDMIRKNQEVVVLEKELQNERDALSQQFERYDDLRAKKHTAESVLRNIREERDKLQAELYELKKKKRRKK